MRLEAPATNSNAKLRIKIEINTHETSPAQPLVALPYEVTSTWFTGECILTTFTSAELVSTKLRALFQRSKGRDVFDLWLALEQLRLDPQAIVDCFGPYRPEGYTASRAIDNLRAKLKVSGFREDLSLLVTALPDGYDIDTASELIIDSLLSKVPG
jgi:hypothetical protein